MVEFASLVSLSFADVSAVLAAGFGGAAGGTSPATSLHSDGSIGAIGGPRRHPYGRIFATVVAPRRGPATEREPVPPLKFSQLVGLGFAVAGVAGFAFGAPLVGVIATAFALAAAFLNAAFGICLGCMLYPLAARLRRPQVAGS